MKVFLGVVNLAALIGAIIWWANTFEWEPAVTSVTLFSALIAQVFTNEKLISKFKLIQNGTAGTQQLQAQNMTVNVGIDEKRAREIYQEMNIQLRKDYSQEAFEIASSRVLEFENKLMPKMEAVGGALEAFSDPSFQLLLVEAQKTAASTERKDDYDLLSELLIHRFQKGDNRQTRAGISRAVEIVDKISDEALLGLTVAHAVGLFQPMSGDVYQGLDALDDLFGKLNYGDLPVGHDWLDHLDILDAIRLSSFGNLKMISQFYPEMLSGYVDVGIEKGSEKFEQAIALLRDNNLPQNILVDHVLNDGFVRLNIVEKQRISSLKIQRTIIHEGEFINVFEHISDHTTVQNKF